MQALSVRPADNACRDAAADRCRDRRTGGGTVDEEGIARVCPFDPIVRNSRACLLLVNYPDARAFQPPFLSPPTDPTPGCRIPTTSRETTHAELCTVAHHGSRESNTAFSRA